MNEYIFLSDMRYFYDKLVFLHVKASFWGLFKTNFYGYFCKLFLFTKLLMVTKTY